MPTFSHAIRAPEFVIAYHGCHHETADDILRSDQFIQSSNAYDWLGVGIYFWEYGPHRALEWAQAKFGSDAAVVQARISLGYCLNLLDPGYFRGIQTIYEAIAFNYQQEGRTLPSNRTDKRHFLDRVIMDEFCEAWVRSGGTPYQTVRGCFPEGEPIYPGSKILRETHIQIAVRDVTCISQVELVE